MKAAGKSNHAVATGVILGAVLLGTVGLYAHRYYCWREGLTSAAFHDDVPLGKFSIGGLHFGACLGEVQGGLVATYCDGPPMLPGGGRPMNPRARWYYLGPKDGNGISLSFYGNGEEMHVVIPLP